MKLRYTYPRWLQNKLAWKLWKNIFCRIGWHLWDEYISEGNRYFYCDACEQMEKFTPQSKAESGSYAERDNIILQEVWHGNNKKYLSRT